uniref:Centrosomin N-terminal motif 1 domain-containing protein n=1 Tax=Microcebus murinus TaxID=30608 RepID=A0A8C5YAQ3_MICMU
RDYFAEDHGEMVPRTSHAAAFLSDTKDRGPPVQSQTWRSGEKVPFGQTYSLRAFEKPLQVQTQALRDFEKHLNDLKKENFSLKLRIYFLEERMQQKYEASREDIYKRVSAGPGPDPLGQGQGPGLLAHLSLFQAFSYLVLLYKLAREARFRPGLGTLRPCDFGLARFTSLLPVFSTSL